MAGTITRFFSEHAKYSGMPLESLLTRNEASCPTTEYREDVDSERWWCIEIQQTYEVRIFDRG